MGLRLEHLRTLAAGRPLRSPTSQSRPIFIIGSGRSGTTLLRAMLVGSPELHIPPETYVLPGVIREYRVYSRLPWSVVLRIVLGRIEYHKEFHTFGVSLRPLYNELRTTAPADQNLALILDRFYRFHATHAKPTATRWGDKTPFNTFALEPIRRVFPHATFVHVVRDGRDVVQSYLAMRRYTSPRDAAQRWARAVRAARRFGARHAQQYIEVRYEALVRAPARVLSEICGAAGLGFDDRMLRHSEAQAPLGDVETYGHLAGVKRPIYHSSIGKWRSGLAKHEVAEVHGTVGSLLRELGYGD